MTTCFDREKCSPLPANPIFPTQAHTHPCSGKAFTLPQGFTAFSSALSDPLTVQCNKAQHSSPHIERAIGLFNRGAITGLFLVCGLKVVDEGRWGVRYWICLRISVYIENYQKSVVFFAIRAVSVPTITNLKGMNFNTGFRQD